MWQLKTRARGSGLDAVKGEVDIGDDVIRIFDADGHAQEAVGDAEALSLFHRQPAVRRDRRIQDLGEKVSDRRRRCGELEAVEEAERRGPGVVAQLERDDPAVEPIELARREGMLRVIR